jgi:hypothetical protein
MACTSGPWRAELIHERPWRRREEAGGCGRRREEAGGCGRRREEAALVAAMRSQIREREEMRDALGREMRCGVGVWGVTGHCYSGLRD